jgi:hypothetical protein
VTSRSAPSIDLAARAYLRDLDSLGCFIDDEDYPQATNPSSPTALFVLERFGVATIRNLLNLAKFPAKPILRLLVLPRKVTLSSR